MTAGWVAATNRGRSLLRGTLGCSGAEDIAQTTSWEEARTQLSDTMYGAFLAPASSRQQARRSAAAATGWQLQVLAGWCPPGSGGLARLFAGPIEIVDIEHQLAGHQSSAAPLPPIDLGSLGNTAHRLSAARSADDVRQILARSWWGDPGSNNPASVALHLRVSWLARLIRRLPASRRPARNAMLLLAARERFVFDRDIDAPVAVQLDRYVGRRWRRPSSINQMAASTHPAFGALSAVECPDQLWLVELAVRNEAKVIAEKVMAKKSFDEKTMAGIMALLLIDLSRVLAAIELAGRGPFSTEVLDAVA